MKEGAVTAVRSEEGGSRLAGRNVLGSAGLGKAGGAGALDAGGGAGAKLKVGKEAAAVVAGGGAGGAAAFGNEKDGTNGEAVALRPVEVLAAGGGTGEALKGGVAKGEGRGEEEAAPNAGGARVEGAGGGRDCGTLVAGGAVENEKVDCEAVAGVAGIASTSADE